MLPWTLPIEFSLGFSKKLLELLPKIKVSNNPSNLLDNVLIQMCLLLKQIPLLTLQLLRQEEIKIEIK